MNCGVTYCLNGNYTENYMNLKYKKRKCKRTIEVHLSRNVINAREKESIESVKVIKDKGHSGNLSHIDGKIKPKVIDILSATTNTSSLKEWPVLKLPSQQIEKTGSKTSKRPQLGLLTNELKQVSVQPLNWKKSSLLRRPTNSAPLQNINLTNPGINAKNIPEKKPLQKKETKFRDKNYNEKNSEPSVCTLIRHTAKSLNRKNVKLVTSEQQYFGSTNPQPINNKKLTIINAPVTPTPSPSATKKSLPKLNQFIDQRLNCKASKQNRKRNDSDFSVTSSNQSFAEWLLLSIEQHSASIPKKKITSKTLDTIKLNNTKTTNRYQILSNLEKSNFQQFTSIKRCVNEVELKRNNTIFILKKIQ